LTGIRGHWLAGSEPAMPTNADVLCKSLGLLCPPLVVPATLRQRMVAYDRKNIDAKCATRTVAVHFHS
jgi:hypothetical protein